MLDAVAHVLTVASAFPAVAFVVTYFRVNWHATAIGRHMMAFMTVCAAILVLATTVAIFGEYRGVDYLRVVVWLAINIIFWWRWIVLVNVLRGKYPAPKCPNCGAAID